MARSRIFISYRRDDSSGQAGRLDDALAAKYGRDNVFMDIDTIAYGEDFVQAIDLAMQSVDVVLVMMGPQWTGPQADGKRRIDNADDAVRLEVEGALKQGCRVIPVLVRDASMLKSTELPASIAEISRHNAIEISEIRWHDDVRRLIEALDDRTPDGPGADARAKSAWSIPPARSTKGVAIGAAGVALIAVLGLVVLNVLGSRGEGNPSPTSPIARGSATPPGSAISSGVSGTATPASSDLATPGTTPIGSEIAYASLLAAIPEAFRDTCAPSTPTTADPLITGDIAQTKCTPSGAGVISIKYWLFQSVDAMRQEWQRRMVALSQVGYPTSTGNCFQGNAGQWLHQKGTVQCDVERDGSIRVRWTDANAVEYGVLQAVPGTSIKDAVAWWGANAVEGGTGP